MRTCPIMTNILWLEQLLITEWDRYENAGDHEMAKHLRTARRAIGRAGKLEVDRFNQLKPKHIDASMTLGLE